MSDQYAVIDNTEKISNIVLWDGESDWQPQEGFTAVACSPGECFIGGSYLEGAFFPPEPESVPIEQLIEQAEQRRATLLSNAQISISVWQTKLLMGRKLTEDESAKLNEWMDYIDLVSGIDPSTAPDISWPVAPR